MLNKKAKKELSDAATRASVKREMAKPRLAKSARIAELKLDAGRIPEPSSTTMFGTVDKIIPPSRPGQPDQASIIVDVPDKRQRNLRTYLH